MALTNSRDQYHQRAARIAVARAASGTHWVGSVLVLSELYDHMMRRRGPEAARRVISDLLADPRHRWLEVTPDLLAAAISAWLERFHDQTFSLTDAVSFEIMRRERINQAFAFDQDFVTAGFRLLA